MLASGLLTLSLYLTTGDYLGLRRSPVAIQGDSQQRGDIRDQRCEGQPPKPLVATARAPKIRSLGSLSRQREA